MLLSLFWTRNATGLSKTIPQMNNFVIYQGFFDDQAMPRYASANSIDEPDIKTTSRYVPFCLDATDVFPFTYANTVR